MTAKFKDMSRRSTLPDKAMIVFLCFLVSSAYSIGSLQGQVSTSLPSGIQATATRTLLNGLRIEILAAPHSARISLHLLIGAGSVFDPQDKAGLAELTVATLVDSVPDWQGDPGEIGKVVEAGKKFQYEVDWDSTHLFTECRAEEIGIYLQALTRFVRYTTLSPVRFETVRNRLMKSATEETSSPRQIAERRFESELFRGNPYARPLKGTTVSLKNIAFGDTVNFQKRYHLPNVSYLSMVGPVQEDAVRRQAGRSLGVWIMDKAFPYTFTPPQGIRELRLLTVNGNPAAETVLVIGQLMVPRSSTEFVSAELLAHILQSARWESCPEVSPSIELAGRRLKGFVRVSVQKQGLPVGKVLSEVRQRWRQLAQTGPSVEECGQAVQRYLEITKEQAGAAPFLARMLCMADTYQLGFNFFERLKQTLPRTTPADLRLSAQKLLTPDQLLAVVSGPLNPSDLEVLKKEGWRISSMDSVGPTAKP